MGEAAGAGNRPLRVGNLRPFKPLIWQSFITSRRLRMATIFAWDEAAAARPPVLSSAFPAPARALESRAAGAAPPRSRLARRARARPRDALAGSRLPRGAARGGGGRGRRRAGRSRRLRRLVRGAEGAAARARAIRSSPGSPSRRRSTRCAGSSTQEAAGEAGFDDLVAMTQVKLPTRAKLELARNYWDEMGRGNPKGMHGPMLVAPGRGAGAGAGDRHHAAREPGARQCDDGDGDEPPLRLAFGRRAGRDRADRARPLRLHRAAALQAARHRAEASDAISTSTRRSTSSIARPGIARRCARWSPRIRRARLAIAEGALIRLNAARAATKPIATSSGAKRSRWREARPALPIPSTSPTRSSRA